MEKLTYFFIVGAACFLVCAIISMATTPEINNSTVINETVTTPNETNNTTEETIE